MSKVRVHELAKGLNLQSKELINIINGLGVEVKSHMSILEGKDLEVVIGHFRKIESEKSKKEEKKSIKRRILNQCARELVLAQSSDWLFIITNGTMVDYAKKRIKDHIGRFTKLSNWISSNHELTEDDLNFLQSIEEIDCIFPEINYELYKKS